MRSCVLCDTHTRTHRRCDALVSYIPMTRLCQGRRRQCLRCFLYPCVIYPVNTYSNLFTTYFNTTYFCKFLIGPNHFIHTTFSDWQRISQPSLYFHSDVFDCLLSVQKQLVCERLLLYLFVGIWKSLAFLGITGYYHDLV